MDAVESGRRYIDVFGESGTAERAVSQRFATEIAEAMSAADDPALEEIREVVLDTTFVVNTGDVTIDGEPLIDVPPATAQIPRE